MKQIRQNNGRGLSIESNNKIIGISVLLITVLGYWLPGGTNTFVQHIRHRNRRTPCACTRVRVLYLMITSIAFASIPRPILLPTLALYGDVWHTVFCNLSKGPLCHSGR